MKLKALIEKRNALMDEMDALLTSAEGETRALTEEESARFTELETQIRELDATIAAAEARNRLEHPGTASTDADEQRTLEERSFLAFCRGETRADGPALDVGQNGAIIPTHIANKIIEKVKELSPIYGMVTTFNVGGNLSFPVYAETSQSIKAAYVADMEELTENVGKFTSVTLENFIVGTLVLISRSLMNRTDFDLLSFIVYRVARTIAEFLERELILGTAGKMVGVMNSANVVTSAATTITADELIDLQMEIPEIYQGSACWIMHKKTLGALRKLKDTTGNYLLNRDITRAFGWELLGRPVYITETAPELAAGKTVIAYGDMSGLYLKFAQGIQLQVLLEKYATRHAIGVVGYVECDSEIVEPQKLVVLKMKAI